MAPRVLSRLADGRYEGQCSHCLKFTPIVKAPAELGWEWEQRDDGLLWCLD
jgi:hypothetical protein